MKLFFIIALSSYVVEGWVTPPNEIIKVVTSTTSLPMATGPGGGRQGKKIQDDMLRTINDVPRGPEVDLSLLDSSAPSSDELAPFVRTIAQAADMRKASDVIAMRISRVTTVASFIVVCSGNSRPQNQAIAAAIKGDVEEKFGDEFVMRGNGVPEGNADSGWILLDYGDVMVHVMTPKSRLFYDIEGQWSQKGGEYMDLDDVLLKDFVPPGMAGEDETKEVGSTMLGIAEEDDPFWS